MTEATIPIGGMTCHGCVATVTNAIKHVEGVELVKVTLDGKSAEVMYDETKVDVAKIREAIAESGYQAVG